MQVLDDLEAGEADDLRDVDALVVLDLREGEGPCARVLGGK